MSNNGDNRNGDAAELSWPDGDLTRIPDWVYTSDEIYDREQERIFRGPTWSYVGFEAEIPNSGDFRRSYVGSAPVIFSRAEDGSVHVMENRCAHRGAEFCRELKGNNPEFMCPYHQWLYNLKGDLIGVPFRRGIKGKGGMPKDFKLEDNGLRKLKVASRGGVVFASFDPDVESLEDYMSPEILKDFDATFDGRKLEILGYWRNRQRGNWKLYHENLKDPYHATLLHTYLTTFGLMVAGQKSAMVADPTGRHGVMASAMGEQDSEIVAASASEMKKFETDYQLEDGRVVSYRPEADSPWSVTMMTVWPNFIVQRELNTLGVRQIVPRGPGAFDMYWTMFGFEDDDADMRDRRLCQANLMGPAGYLGAEDNEAIAFVQDGVESSTTGSGIVTLDSEAEGTSTNLISESAIRAMYRHYCGVMDL
jgi:phenylpropionate dioxygenase-like ring-hydroxylating dioxygenase large terminal subunit